MALCVQLAVTCAVVSVQFSKTATVPVLKSVARKRIMETVIE
jgi:hypothetical protein